MVIFISFLTVIVGDLESIFVKSFDNPIGSISSHSADWIEPDYLFIFGGFIKGFLSGQAFTLRCKIFILLTVQS